MNKNIFVTGIGTDVGKTIASAILCESLKADYWKPIQAGDLDNSDSIKVKKLSSDTTIHKEKYKLNTPASPDFAAEMDKVKLASSQIIRPSPNNHLIIEGAGGLLVPINESETISDLIQANDYVVLVSRNYLGSINHTLLSLAFLQNISCKKIGILFVGEENLHTQNTIQKKTGVKAIGRIDQAEEINLAFIIKQAEKINIGFRTFLNLV